jgi:hypothetical protein
MSLLAIESAFLSRPEVKTGLHLKEISTLNKAVTTATRKRFNQSVELAGHVAAAAEWYKTEGKQALSEAGIEWNTEAFARKAFGFGKSFYHRMVKVGNLPAEKVNEYVIACDEADANGEPAERSLEQLLRFAKGGGVTQETGEEGESGGESESEGGESESEGGSAPALYTFTCGRLSLSVDSNGVIHCNQELSHAADMLSQLLEHVKATLES